MMKKLLAMLLAVLLMSGGAAMADTAQTRSAYTGTWALRTLSLLGREMGAEELDYAVFVNIHEDDTCLFAMGESFAVTSVRYEDDVCFMLAAAGDIPLTIDGQGVMHMSLTADGLTMGMQLVRGEAASAPPELLPYTGTWALTRLEVGGTVQTIGGNAGFTLRIYEDCAALLTRLDGSADMFRLVSVEGVAALLDMQGRTFPVALEAGQLRFATPLGESEVLYVLNRVGEAPVIVEAGPEAAAETESDEAAADEDAVRTEETQVETAEPAATETSVQKRVVVTADKARVREKPDISADQVKVAYKGESFVYLDEIPNWYIIECNGRKAYIHMGVTAIE